MDRQSEFPEQCVFLELCQWTHTEFSPGMDANYMVLHAKRW